MAGGKLSPRQKMINMMYLVLTALLALNVSKEILLSFLTIANSLRSSSEKLGEKNHALAENIKHTVEEQLQNNPNANIKIIPPLVNEVTSFADKVTDHIERHIKALQRPDIAGFDTLTKNIAQLDQTEMNYRYFMYHPQDPLKDDHSNNGRGSGAAKMIRDTLKEYIDWANAKYVEYSNINVPDNKKITLDPAKPYFRYMCVDPKDDPKVPKGTEAKDKTWEYYTFHYTPAIANVAILEKLKTDIAVVETELLEVLKSKLGQVKFKIKGMKAFPAPESKIVVAGMPFEAKIYVVPQLEDSKATFSGPGVKQDAKNPEYGLVKLTADGRNIKAGERDGKQMYSVKVRIPKADGTDEIIDVKDHFIVRRPNFKFSSAAVTILYRDCGNELQAEAPDLGSLFSPEFKATEAKVFPSKKDPAKIRVVPTGKKCVIQVNNKMNNQVVELGKTDFNVVPPPKPTVALYSGKNQLAGASAQVSAKQTVKLKVTAQSDFAKALPDDARYRMVNVKIFRKSGLGSATEVKSYADSPVGPESELDIKLATILTDPKKGEVIYVEVDKVQRKNFEGKFVDEPMGASEKTFVFTISD